MNKCRNNKHKTERLNDEWCKMEEMNERMNE